MNRTAAFAFALLVATTTVRAAPDAAALQRALDDPAIETVSLEGATIELDAALRIDRPGKHLVGPGRLVQRNADAYAVHVLNAADVVLRDLTITRPAEGGKKSAIFADGCTDLSIDDVRVIGNASPTGAIYVTRTRGARIVGCLIRDYGALTLEDRTRGGQPGGVAFTAVEATGLAVTYSTDVLIDHNRIVETVYRGTQEVRDKYDLGRITKRNPTTNPVDPFPTGYTTNWHQGSAIVVTGPRDSDRVRIVNNSIENCGQGIDVHADRVIIANNIVDNATCALKVMHGSRHAILTGNQLIRCDLWAIVMLAGTASRAGDNVDGGTVIANNIVSDFGYGDAHWRWGDERTVFYFDQNQTPDPPPLRDVTVVGNIISDLQPPVATTQPTTAATTSRATTRPRYRYAIGIATDGLGRRGPINIRFSGNLFTPGTGGVSNVPLQE